MSAPRAARQALPAVVFGIPWTAFSVFWTAMALLGSSKQGGGFILFPLFGLPFVLIGLGLLSSPYWAYRWARVTAYALTDRRAISITVAKGKRVRSYVPRGDDGIVRHERADGSGDLLLQPQVAGSDQSSETPLTFSFRGVENVRAVEELVRETFARERLAA